VVGGCVGVGGGFGFGVVGGLWGVCWVVERFERSRDELRRSHS
jgi:hypothetical protein